jgi:hypothetical protein
VASRRPKRHAGNDHSEQISRSPMANDPIWYYSLISHEPMMISQTLQPVVGCFFTWSQPKWKRFYPISQQP